MRSGKLTTKVTVQISALPRLYEVFGARTTVEIQFRGNTVGQLLEHAISRFGTDLKHILFESDLRWKREVKVVLNGEVYLNEGCVDVRLKDGDRLLLQDSA